MVKVLVLATICIIGIWRWMVADHSGGKSKYLLISLFSQTLAFAFGKAVVSYMHSSMAAQDDPIDLLGAFGNDIRIELPIVCLIFFAFLGYTRLEPKAFSIRKNPWIYILLLLCVISLINPFNPFHNSVFPFISFVL